MAEEVNATPNKPDTEQKNEEIISNKEISFDIYSIILKSRQNHGVPTEDYDVYRKYLSKQLSILRKKLKLQCLDPKNSKTQQIQNAQQNKLKKDRLKKIKSGKLKPKRDRNWNRKYKRYDNKKKTEEITWKNREISIFDLLKNRESILISLYLCERAWSHSKVIYEEYDEDHKRKYHHSNNRLKKSIIFANKLYKLLSNKQLNINININNNTISQSFGYLSWLKSTYYLQTEQIELSLFEYLKSMKINKNILYLENNNKMNINTKLAYFNENIKKQKRIEIEENVNKFIKNLKEELNINDDDNDNDEMKGNDDEIKKKEKKQKLYIQYNQNKVIVPNIDNLEGLIKGLYDELDELETKGILKANTYKKQEVFTKIVLIIDKSLEIIQKELKKFTNSAIQDVAANTYFVMERYLLFQKLRFSISRQCLWIKNIVKNRNNFENNKRILYELSVLSERQIGDLDELSTITDLTNYKGFMQQIEILRNRFEIYRKYCIAKIYYFVHKNYINSYQIFEHHVIPSSNDYINKFIQYKGGDIKDKMYDLSELIDINHSKQIINDILLDSQKLAMLAKANCILLQQEKEEKEENDDDNNNNLILIDMKDKLYPLLTKPIMIDIAWNYVDYNDIFEGSAKNKDNKNKPKEPQKQTSWFGGFFGGQ